MRIFNKVLGSIVVLTMLLLLLLSVSCMNSSDQSASGTENGQNGENTQNGDEIIQIEMINFKFDPDMVTIKQGTTVTWVNKDGVAHTVVSGVRDNKSGLFDSGNISSGGTFSYTFNDKGTFDYFCEPHSGMDGIVVVE